MNKQQEAFEAKLVEVQGKLTDLQTRLLTVISTKQGEVEALRDIADDIGYLRNVFHLSTNDRL